MSHRTGTESDFEQELIDRLTELGYAYQPGGQIQREAHEVLLLDELRGYLSRRYHQLPRAAIDYALDSVRTLSGLTPLHRNMAFQQMFRNGLTVPYDAADGSPQEAHLYLANFEAPELNRWLVVNQLPIQGVKGNDRRPDVLIYLNGLPVILFELKSPKSEYVDVGGAYQQIQHYTHDLPRLFEYNGFCVVSDGLETLQGVHTASFEWFVAWKSIDGQSQAPASHSRLRVLLEGLFPKARLLTYLRYYLVHEQDEGHISKKSAKYHQFFAVQTAVERAIEAMQPKGDKRVGVVWHTQGSGKSLEMVFLVGILRHHPGLNPTFLIQVDRDDLDTQLYDHFVAAKDLVGSVEQAETIEHLRGLFTEPGRVVCSTIEKFALQAGETTHPPLYRGDNILVIADEAHRTQYGDDAKTKQLADGSTKISQGYALSLRQAFPNAAFIAFTGTPIDSEDRDTQQIFGNIFHTYDMEQATADGAVVPIFYEAHHVPLKLSNDYIDIDWDGLTEEHELTPEQSEDLKKEFANIAALAAAKPRVDIVGRHIVNHFNQRIGLGGVSGKGMVVCMDRPHCVRLYEAMTAITDCPETKIVMTGDPAKDPVEWSERGYLTTSHQRQKIKGRFIDPDDPLKLVIVCDMWLTGFDAPPLHTMYIDKTMKGHNLMQGIARVNRVFKDKPNGLIVDMLGIGDQLKQATQKYTQSGGKGELTEDLRTQAVAYFMAQLERVRQLLPDLTAEKLPPNGYQTWRTLTRIQLGDLFALCYGTLGPHQELRDDYLTQEHRLSKAYSLIRHLPTGQANSDEVQLYQMIRHQLRRLEPKARQSVETMKRAVRDLLDESLEADQLVDIFATAGLNQPSINILDRQFLGEFATHPQQDLQARLLYKLLNDELDYYEYENIVQYRSFKERLEHALIRYNSRETPAQELVKAMLTIREEQTALDQRKTDLGLDTEQLAFYDILAAHLTLEQAVLTDLAQQIVTLLHDNLKVDWTKPHRNNISAKIQQGLRPILRGHITTGESLNIIRQAIMEQVTANYKDWPIVASHKKR